MGTNLLQVVLEITSSLYYNWYKKYKPAHELDIKIP